MSKKATATHQSNIRERLLSQNLNGDMIDEDEVLTHFPCSSPAFASLVSQVYRAEPGFRLCTKIGGLGHHKDLEFQTETSTKGVELKVCDKAISPDVLQWHPWEGAVQFLQGQIVSKTMASFLGPCGPPMVAAWLEKVSSLMALRLPDFTRPTLDDYTKVLFTIGSEKKLTTPAAKLIQELRVNDALRAEFQKTWLAFEDEWFSSHTPDTAAFRVALNQILGEKDYWININKNGAFLIEGFHVVDLTYVGTAKKPGGGSVFRYRIRLQKKKNKEIQEVPIVLKFYWKNGGQGVQNINILCVSDPFA